MALLHFTISRLLIMFVPGEICSNIISIVSGLIRNNKCIRSKSCCNRNEIICFMSVWIIQFVYSSSDEFSLSIGSVILKKCKLWDDFFQFLGANIFVWYQIYWRGRYIVFSGCYYNLYDLTFVLKNLILVLIHKIYR